MCWMDKQNRKYVCVRFSSDSLSVHKCCNLKKNSKLRDVNTVYQTVCRLGVRNSTFVHVHFVHDSTWKTVAVHVYNHVPVHVCVFVDLLIPLCSHICLSYLKPVYIRFVQRHCDDCEPSCKFSPHFAMVFVLQSFLFKERFLQMSSLTCVLFSCLNKYLKTVNEI